MKCMLQPAAVRRAGRAENVNLVSSNNVKFTRAWGHAPPPTIPTPARRSCFCSLATSQPVDGGYADPLPRTSTPGDVSAEYQTLVSELAGLTPQQLREAAHLRPAQLLDSGFLFWLRDQERRPGLGGAERGLLSRLGQELTLMREWTEEQANRTLLPSLASSLAYTNLRRWREETGEQAPKVAAGVDLEQLYRLGEEEERKLQESMERGTGGGGLGPRRGVSRSGIEEFTKHNPAYADLAAGAMARVRARLMGFDDEGPSAAAAVLTALLHQMGSAEERATFLPDAFTPPGLQIMPDAAATTGSFDGGGGGGKPSFVVTTPDALTAAVGSRLASLATTPTTTTTAAAAGSSSSAEASSPAVAPASGPADAASSSPPSLSAPSAPSAPSPSAAFSPSSPSPPSRQPSSASSPASSSSSSSSLFALRGQVAEGARRRGAVLPSGEDEEAALVELLELIEEYDRHVYSRKTPLERMGHNPGPW